MQTDNQKLHAFLLQLVHDLRSPLNAVTMWLDLLRAKASSDDVHTGLDVIQRNFAQQADVLQQLSEAVQLQSETPELSTGSVAAGQLANQIREFASERIVPPQLTWNDADLPDGSVRLNHEAFFKALGISLDYFDAVSPAGSTLAVAGVVDDGVARLHIDIDEPTGVSSEPDLAQLLRPPWDREREIRTGQKLNIAVFVAKRLIAAQGGDLRPSNRSIAPGGGLTIALTLH